MIPLGLSAGVLALGKSVGMSLLERTKRSSGADEIPKESDGGTVESTSLTNDGESSPSSSPRSNPSFSFTMDNHDPEPSNGTYLVSVEVDCF